jgi:hypothetical protein
MERHSYGRYFPMTEHNNDNMSIKVNSIYLNDDTNGFEHIYTIAEDRKLPHIFKDRGIMKEWLGGIDFFELEFYIVHKLPRKLRTMPAE